VRLLQRLWPGAQQLGLIPGITPVWSAYAEESVGAGLLAGLLIEELFGGPDFHQLEPVEQLVALS
jgi:hypothetical protein